MPIVVVRLAVCYTLEGAAASIRFGRKAPGKHELVPGKIRRMRLPSGLDFATLHQ